MHLCEYARKVALALLLEGVRAADPARLLRERVAFDGRRLRVAGYEVDVGGGAYIVALGKAAGPMAEAVEQILGDAVRGGIATLLRGAERMRLKRVVPVVAGHPRPDEGSLRAGELALRTAERAREEGVPLIVLLSGGGSAMAELPVPGVSLGDLQALTDLLLRSGASIGEINAVRKHLSLLKGGRLAATARPSPVLTLVLSDVVGDRLDVIASGPTVPDPTTYSDALRVLQAYGVLGEAPKPVVAYLERGCRGEAPETPKPGELDNSLAVVIGNNMTALRAMKAYAEGLGFRALILSSSIGGEAREAGRVLASVVLEAKRSGNPLDPPAVILCGGETTVTVRGKGRGGRNQEFALAAAIEIAGEEGVAVAAMGSDGVDGPTDAAGAVVDGHTIPRAKQLGIDPAAYLRDNDSYTFFRIVGGHIVTGPTRTNVNDFYVGVVATEEVTW